MIRKSFHKECVSRGNLMSYSRIENACLLFDVNLNRNVVTVLCSRHLMAL